MEFSGERLIPEIGGKAAYEHLARYAYASSFTTNKCVLDIACGEGYGSFLLSKNSKKIVGVDLNEEVIKHASSKYKSNNLSFFAASIFNLPFEDGYFDLIICVETIEHVMDQKSAISELKRVLKPGGLLFISTPEKDVYNKDGLGNLSHYHEKELTSTEFIDLISIFFKRIEVLKQIHIDGSLIYSDLGNISIHNYVSGGFDEFILKDVESEFNLIIASNNELPEFASSFLYRDYELIKTEIDYLSKIKVNKVLSGFRYRVINFLFKPIDYFKSLFSK